MCNGSNHLATSVYPLAMRSFHPIFLLLPFATLAQPGPHSVTFTVAANTEELQPISGDVRVVMHFTQRAEWGITPRNLGTMTELPTSPLFTPPDTTWSAFWIPSCWCTDMMLEITVGGETMWLALPDDLNDLEMRAMQRAHNETPEVIRFRPGRFVFEEEIMQPWNERATLQMKRMIKADQLANNPYRTPLPTDVLYTQDTILLDKARYRMGETVRARISGTVRTDGSCSASPLYELRAMRPVTGLISDPCSAPQMDCGLPTVFWEDAPLDLHLADRRPGKYALVVCGIGMAEFVVVR